MKVKVTKENVLITESTVVNESELMINVCDFQLPDCFKGLTVTAMFNNIPVPLTGTRCYIPALKNGTAVLGVYAYKEDASGELTLMYSPKPACFFVNKGSYSEHISVEKLPTVTEFERYCAAVSALTFPKTDVIGDIDLEKDFTDSQVYSAGALNLALAEVGNLLGSCFGDIASLRESTEKTANKVTSIGKDSTNLQYPSAAAVYKGICAQSEKTEQVKTELAADIDALSNSMESLESELKAEVHRVECRVDENAVDINSLITEQGIVNETISRIQGDISQLQERASALSDNIQDNKGDISGLNEISEEIQNDIRNLSDSIESVREMVNSRVTDNANAIKGIKAGVDFVEISDVSPLTHYLDVTVSGDGAVGSTIECRGKNMFTFKGRTLADFGMSGHEFTGNNIFLSMAASGYYKKNTGSWEYDEKTDTYTIPCANAWYGPGIDFKVCSGEKYFFSAERITQGSGIQASFYDADGNYITYISGVENRNFTVPMGAEWMVIIFISKEKDYIGELVCPQLERGSEATGYEVAVETQCAIPDESGKITSFRSVSPTTVVSSRTFGNTVSCIYNRDTNKAYERLVDAVLSLGGSV